MKKYLCKLMSYLGFKCNKEKNVEVAPKKEYELNGEKVEMITDVPSNPLKLECVDIKPKPGFSSTESDTKSDDVRGSEKLAEVMKIANEIDLGGKKVTEEKKKTTRRKPNKKKVNEKLDELPPAPEPREPRKIRENYGKVKNEDKSTTEQKQTKPRKPKTTRKPKGESEK